MITNFEDLIAWRKAEELSYLIYKIFKSSRDYSFKDQIQRAVVSVMNNIAEGYERKGNKEYIRFLYIAKGSCGEVRSMLHLALKLDYLDDKIYNKLVEKAIEVSKILYGLIKKL